MTKAHLVTLPGLIVATACSSGAQMGSCQLGFSSTVSPKVLGGIVTITPNSRAGTVPVSELLSEPPLTAPASCTFLAEFEGNDQRYLNVVTSGHCLRFSEHFIEKAQFSFYIPGPEGQSGYLDPVELQTLGMNRISQLHSTLQQATGGSLSEERLWELIYTLVPPPRTSSTIDYMCSDGSQRGKIPLDQMRMMDLEGSTDACFAFDDMHVMTIDLNKQQRNSQYQIERLRQVVRQNGVGRFNTARSAEFFEGLVLREREMAQWSAGHWFHLEGLGCLTPRELEERLASSGLEDSEKTKAREAWQFNSERAAPLCSQISQLTPNVGRILSWNGDSDFLKTLKGQYDLTKFLTKKELKSTDLGYKTTHQEKLTSFYMSFYDNFQFGRADFSSINSTDEFNRTVREWMVKKSYIIYGAPALRSPNAKDGTAVNAPLHLVKVDGSDLEGITGSYNGFVFSSSNWPVDLGKRDSGSIMLTDEGFIIGTLAAVDGKRSSGGASVVPLPSLPGEPTASAARPGTDFEDDTQNANTSDTGRQARVDLEYEDWNDDSSLRPSLEQGSTRTGDTPPDPSGSGFPQGTGSPEGRNPAIYTGKDGNPDGC